MISRFLKSKWWHLFATFYMAAVIAYVVFFAVVHRIFMAGFLVSTVFMLAIEIWIFATSKKNA